MNTPTHAEMRRIRDETTRLMRGHREELEARTYAQAQIDACLRDLEKALVDGDIDKANLEASTALIAGAPRGKVEDLMVRYTVIMIGSQVKIGKGYMVWTVVALFSGKANLKRTDCRGDKVRRLAVPMDKLTKV